MSLRTGHLAVSLGLGDALLESVKKGSSQASAKAVSQWHFRVARLHGEANPYRHLLPKGSCEQILAAVDHCKSTGLPLHVQMNGGIGDPRNPQPVIALGQSTEPVSIPEMHAERQQQTEPLLFVESNSNQ